MRTKSFWSISLILLLALMSSRGAVVHRTTAQPERDCNVSADMMPRCFFPREKPEVRAVFVHYGSAMTQETMDRLKTKLIEKFNSTSNGTLTLNIIDSAIVPFKKMPRDLNKMRESVPNGDESKREEDRLLRLWYYYNVDMNILGEIYQQVKLSPIAGSLKNSDIIISTTEAQFNGLGYASGRVAVMEYPSEIAWKGPDGGFTEFSSDDTIIDELLHETAHTIGLDHTSQQCDLPELVNPTREVEAAAHKESTACCAASENANDVLSYCRKRPGYYKVEANGFGVCNQNLMKTYIAPALVNGGDWKLFGAVCL